MGKGKKKGGGGGQGGGEPSQGQGSAQRQEQPQQPRQQQDQGGRPQQGQQQGGRPQQGQQQGGRSQDGQYQGGRPQQGQQQGGRPQQAQQQGGRPQQGQQQGGRSQDGQYQGGRPQQGQQQGGRPHQGQQQGGRSQDGQYQGGRPQQGQQQGGRPQQGQQQGGRSQDGQYQGGRPQQGQQQGGRPQQGQQQGGRPQQGAWGQPRSQEQQQQQQQGGQGAWGQSRPQEQQQPPASSAWGQQKQQQQQPSRPQAPPVQDTAGIAKSMERMSVSEQGKSEPGAKADSDRSSRAPSVASSAGGDAASVKSSGSAAQGTPKKESPGGLDKKSLTDKEKNRLMSLIPTRKDPLKAGTKGRKIQVYTNMVQIIFNSKFKVNATHYDVKFDPDKPKFLKRLAFNKLREEKFPKNWPAFDGRVNAYSAGDLPFGKSITHTVQVFDEERQQERPVVVTMEKVNVIDMSWLPKVSPGLKEEEKDQTSIQVLDVVLRSAQFTRSIPVGRSFFQQPRSQAFNLSDGMELWVGMFQSAVLGWKPYFNVDVAHKAFPKSISVIEAMKDLCADRRAGPPRELTADMVSQNLDKITKYLKGLKVVFQLPNKPSTRRTVGVNGLDKPADAAVFTLDNGQQCTVANYFSGSKQYRLQYPKLPCLWVGSRQKHVLLPPELCTIAAGTVTNRKLNDEQTRRMIKEAAKPAPERKARIEDALHSINFNADPTMQEFGISLNGQLEKVDARVLDPPALQYADIKNVRVQKGVWRASKFLTAQNIPENSWTILNLSRCHEGCLRDFVKMLQDFGRSNGMTIGNPSTPFAVMQCRNPRDISNLSRTLDDLKKNKMQLVVVVIPGFPPDVYARVKQQAELQVGILTQCVKDQTISKCVDRNDRSTAGNILLKINSKLNGINHTFNSEIKPACLRVPAIIFGADVTHPSPDATDIPSIAAVAASQGADVFKYNIEIKLQPARQEIILQLEEIVFDQLNIFKKNTGRRPEKIFYYRDGVSEGQFPQVMHFELQAMRNACRRFGQPDKYEPKITFLVVQKRHHIRLFPADGRNSDDRGGNVQAGTIVDTKITHPSHIDFYLVSHASIQGTARPTKYRCLWDDNDMSEDDIETLTYYLCHMFSRCTRSVSYPAPTYYAHLAAFRARALISGVPIQMNNLEREQKTKLTLKPDLVNNNPMFFV
ncbi:protein argonaute-2 [Microplitis demolitor]|uniref:protein argonaute-2 n=1 Tax=Microplitis demolitor TaxID=69319 RepID=UPI00235B5D29|nr:protein argonaute-2 [Microplitis demolitor]